jgi:hypothetical protein
MALISVERARNITLHESELTSLWSFLTRTLGKPAKETEQMTATVLAGAVSCRFDGTLAPG